MNIIANKSNKEYSFERNGVKLRSKFAPEAVCIVLDKFNVRKNYIAYPLKDGKRYKPPFTVSDKYLNSLKKWKPPRFLNDQMIINAMEGTIDYQYGVGFAQSYKDELEGRWRSDYPTNYGLADLDHKPDRELDYYSTPEVVINAFAKYKIKLHETDSSETGKHAYFFLKFYVLPQNLARVIAYICKVEGLKVQDGLLELFPRVKASKNVLYKGHRLPCQPGSSHNIEEFAKLILHGKSEITEDEFNELLKKSFTKNLSKEKYFDEINKGWTREGMTQWLTLKIAIWHRIYSEYNDIEELNKLCVDFAINAPGYKKYCGHQDDIENVMSQKVNEAWNNNHKYESANRYNKRSEIEKERIPKIEEMLKQGNSINQIALSLKADKRTVIKLIKDKLPEWDITGGEITHTLLIRSIKLNSIGELTTTMSQNEKSKNKSTKQKLEDKFNKLNRVELRSVRNSKDKVEVGKLAKLLNCSTKTLNRNLGNKDELTKLVNNQLGYVTKSYHKPNKTTPKTLPKPKPILKVKEEIKPLKTSFTIDDRTWNYLDEIKTGEPTMDKPKEEKRNPIYESLKEQLELLLEFKMYDKIEAFKQAAIDEYSIYL